MTGFGMCLGCSSERTNPAQGTILKAGGRAASQPKMSEKLQETLFIHTPIITSPISSHTVKFKLENLQPSGSFKLRGISKLCQMQSKTRESDARILSSSGGNAGLACAFIAKRLGVTCVVVVPQTISEHARSILMSLGATVITHGKVWNDAHSHLWTLVRPSDVLVHPFDDALIWDGHATMIDEAATQISEPDFVVCSVGGGGLLNGVVQGCRRNNWTRVRVIAVETVGADSLHQSLRAKSRITLDAITSIATSLGALQVSQQTFEYASDPNTRITSVTVTDKEAIQACVEFLDQHRMLVEPACGAALAVLAPSRITAFPPNSTILVIVCGGAIMTASQLFSLSGSVVQ